MAETRESIHGQWSSRLVFILAAAGSAVGLGNVWRFPYVTGENGGGAFVLVYLACILLIGLPVMIAEILLGRRGRRSPINTMRYLAHEEGRHPAWQLLGWWGVLGGFLILSFYSVIAGWGVAYAVRMANGLFEGVTAEAAQGIFNALLDDPERLLAWHTVFMVLVGIVVSRGVRGGLEYAVLSLMPGLFLILLILIGYAVSTGHFDEAARYLFQPDFRQLTWDSVLAAMGQAFFTLSLGMGAIMIYGSYLPGQSSIAGTSGSVVLLDTLVAVLAGLAIFPIVFANGIDPAEGPGLAFVSLPLAFGTMPWGTFFGTLFFLLLTFAAWTSAISLMEPVVAYLVENRNISRVQATVWAAAVTWVVGLGSVLSFNYWSDLSVIGGLNIFELLEFLSFKIILPIGGLLIAIFAGWLMSQPATRDELALSSGGYAVWRFVIRYVAPSGIALVFIATLFKALS